MCVRNFICLPVRTDLTQVPVKCCVFFRIQLDRQVRVRRENVARSYSGKHTPCTFQIIYFVIRAMWIKSTSVVSLAIACKKLYTFAFNIM